METVQRIEAYKAVLKQFEDGTEPYEYTCDCLQSYTRDMGQTVSPNQIEVVFIEFRQQMPKLGNDHEEQGDGLAWWPLKNKEVRKQALRNAIALAEASLVNS